MCMAKRRRTEAQKKADRLRTGRPPKLGDEKQGKRVSVNLTLGEHAYLQELASKEGVSLAEIIMRPWREKEK